MCYVNGLRRYAFGVLFACAALLAALTPTEARAETRRAVVVGINRYLISGEVPVPRGNPPDARVWVNLRGAGNDAKRIRDLLIARFGFKREDVTVLLDGAATRAAILAALEDDLVAKSQPGDVALFFYAGHGSLVVNSLAPEGEGGHDETIVPADAMRGVRDIRDKELRDVFNRILDKRALLTAILDSCHSGSIARGPMGTPPGLSRQLVVDTRDVKDGSRAPDPAARGALILSAAQDDQPARESTDEFNNEGGLYSIALTRALRVMRPDESADDLHRRIRAMIKDGGEGQEPVLEGTPQRRAGSLFGTTTAGGSGRTVAAVSATDGTRVVLQEGVAAGFTEGSELARVDGTPVRLRIENVDGLVTSTAKIVAGNAQSVQKGDLFVVDRWAPPRVSNLRVWVPAGAASLTSLVALQRQIRDAVTARGHKWVDDPVDEQASHVVSFANGQWSLSGPEAAPTALGASPTGAALLAKLPAPSSKVKVFMALPMPSALRAVLELGEGTPNNAVAMSASEDADYHLVGRAVDGRVSYAWVRPWAFTASTSTLPNRTDWIELAGDGASGGIRLTELASRLAHLNAWLRLDGPPDSAPFPYRLAIQPAGGAPRFFEGAGRAGERFNLVLASDAAHPSGQVWRFVYVFVVDSSGASKLLFPRGAALENRFPPMADAESAKPLYALPFTGFKVGTPFGRDTFLMITTTEQLSDPTVLQWDGVRKERVVPPQERGTPDANKKALMALFGNVGASSRGAEPDSVPTTWNIEKVSLTTSP